MKLFSHQAERPEPRKRWQKNDRKTNLPSAKAACPVRRWDQTSVAANRGEVKAEAARRASSWGSPGCVCSCSLCAIPLRRITNAECV